jgi:CheY-like chemotaxis protein
MSIEVKAVLVTRDSEMIGIFSDQFRSLGVETESVEDLTSAANRWLRSRIEGIVLDFDDLGEQLSIFAELRNKRSNQDAVVIGVATGRRNQEVASQNGAQFLVARPFVVEEVQQTLEAAHRLMVSGRRAHFRLTTSLRVYLRTGSGITIECTTINVSQSGMAILSPHVFNVGESLSLSFLIPGCSVVLKGPATVVWDDKHGKAGLRFEFVNEHIGEHLHAWLDDQCLIWHKVG